MTRIAYGPAITALLTDRLPELGPGSPNESMRAALKAIEAPAVCRAGLWLLHDFLDESHSISQDLDTREGSFWHAIMHRREPDPSNSKYWWRLVGPHPVLERLREAGVGFTTPQAFVDECERVRGTGSPDEERARRVQLLEWQLLFDWCFRLRDSRD
jgi:hypothetical protein